MIRDWLERRAIRREIKACEKLGHGQLQVLEEYSHSAPRHKAVIWLRSYSCNIPVSMPHYETTVNCKWKCPNCGVVKIGDVIKQELILT